MEWRWFPFRSFEKKKLVFVLSTPPDGFAPLPPAIPGHDPRISGSRSSKASRRSEIVSSTLSRSSSSVRSPSKATAAAPHGEKTLSGVAEVLAALGTQERRLAAMKEDNRATLRAASEAQKAVDYIMERTAQADRMAAE